MRSDEILHAMHRRHPKDLWFTEVRDGSSWDRQHHRLDALAIRPSWSTPLLTGYEIKISRSDFLRDDKWLAYLPVTHQFSFACPWDLIQPTELPEQVGLYWVAAGGKIKQVRKPVLRPMDALPTGLLYHLILSHLEPDRHPFFTDQRAYLAAWVEARNDGQLLGANLGSKLGKAYAQEMRDAAPLRARIQEVEAEIAALRQVLEARGLWRWGYTRTLEALADALDGERSAPAEAKAMRHVRVAQAELAEALKLLVVAQKGEANGTRTKDSAGLL